MFIGVKGWAGHLWRRRENPSRLALRPDATIFYLDIVLGVVDPPAAAVARSWGRPT